MYTHKSNRDNGLTVVELLIVLAILVILVVTTITSIRSIEDNRKSSTSAIAQVVETQSFSPLPGGMSINVEGVNVYSGDLYVLSCKISINPSTTKYFTEFKENLAERGLYISYWQAVQYDEMSSNAFIVNAAGNEEELESNIAFVNKQLKELEVYCMQE